MPVIAICEDEPFWLRKIHEAAESFLAARPVEGASIADFSSAAAFLGYLEGHPCPRVALLDVCMPGVSGVQLARHIRAGGSDARIIFLSSSREYAVDAFALNADHYLVKPFTQAQFAEAMGRVADALHSGPKRISIQGAGGSVTIVDAREISYIESIGYRRHVHTGRGELEETRRTLGQFMEELEALCPGQFIAPYRGYIVNLAAVRTVTPRGIQMKDGANIIIKSGDFRMLKGQLFRYSFPEEGGGG